MSCKGIDKKASSKFVRFGNKLGKNMYETEKKKRLRKLVKLKVSK